VNPVAPEPRPPATPAHHGWQWFAPRVGVAAFVLALLGLLWVLHRQEQEEKRSAVIRDVLWVEQNVRFSLGRDLEQLAHLGADSPGADPRQLELRIAYQLQNAPGLLRVLVLDADGSLRASAPAPPDGGGTWPTPTSAATHALALSTGNPAYAPPRASAAGQVFEVFVPFYRDGRPAGTVVGVYGLQTMLAAIVPWWLAEKHLVTIRDAGGAVLAAKSNVEARRPELSHQVMLDPPGHGLVLHLESYGGETRLLPNVLTAAIVSLAAAMIWNLWALRRHVRRRLATEEALRAEHAFRKAMEDSLHTGMRAVDLEGRLVYVNPAFCNMVGYPAAELIGTVPPRPYWPPEEREQIEAAFRAARAPDAGPAGFEIKLVRRGGEMFDALVYEAPLIDAEGRQTGWMGSILDITERKRARELYRQQEEKLAATARLVTVGEMASTMAHELNQPLSAIASYITGSLNLLQGGEAGRGEVQEALRKAVQQTQRAGRIIRRVHDFVRKSEPIRTAVRVNSVVEEAVGFADGEARKRRVRIVSRLAEDDPEVQADPLLLQQVVLNLLRNAMDAMAGTPLADREIRVSTQAGPEGVTVAISDRGCGIPDEIRQKLFEPFFTTKPEGMGMGLNICRSIMELHRGRVWAEPNLGGGTVFSFSLPVDAPASAAPGEAAPGVRQAGGGAA
jgi:two-component system sensor histidine kinase DctS